MGDVQVANCIASLFTNCLAIRFQCLRKVHTDVVGINLSFVINSTKTSFFGLFQGQQRERDKLHDKYVRLVFCCALVKSKGVKINRDTRSNNSNYNSMSNVRSML